MNVPRTYSVGPITVTKHAIEWNDLEGSVRRRLAEVEAGSTVYLNPEYTITATADAPIDKFVRQARRAQALWNKRLARAIGAGARKRAVKRADPANRQLKFTGVMLVNGEPQHPKGWPDVRQKRSA